MKEAYLYKKIKDKQVSCRLCNHFCLIEDGQRGLCGVRENRSGTLISLVYGKVIAANCDPIEKKPLFHFLPGTRSYSIATVGCNFKCLFCQNSDISQMPSDRNRIMGTEMTPDQIVSQALNHHACSISYTYTEPTIFFELTLDTARKASAKRLKNVFVTNGYMSKDCLESISTDLHAANVDLKSFRESFYRQQCNAKLKPVLNTLEIMKNMGVWLEVTTLLIPQRNDSPEELKDIAGFLATLDPNIPWHISRFHPTYRLTNALPTPRQSIQRAREIGLEAGLKYVYSGNLPGDEGEKTFCHKCGTSLIDRIGFSIMENRIKNGHCPKCGSSVPGIWH